jgi:peptidoglycan hydrolase CwlO-like protein
VTSLLKKYDKYETQINTCKEEIEQLIQTIKHKDDLLEAYARGNKQ